MPKRKTGRDKRIFKVTERKVAEMVGITMSMIHDRRIKHLVEGEDWVLDWRTIYYSPKGMRKVMALFDVVNKAVEVLPSGEEPATQEPQGEGEVPVAQEVVVVREDPPVEPDKVVVRKIYPNKRLVLGLKGGQEVFVMVRDNRKLRPGVPMRVVFEREPNWYRCVRVLRK